MQDIVKLGDGNTEMVSGSSNSQYCKDRQAQQSAATSLHIFPGVSPLPVLP